ncbi:hypothetical protein [Marinithermus hydrothermalis]|uniref:Uncharacterized protein n=1 Tax=Marinithermus hydrothermalis (strain DSM 14884 / JCM 11576 / T1) TaxID=869210 RepID=F2NNP4_MARHT|nr:hypothetical protein [Marinithermus hydrothermalis]AEB11059.1 hypothetical protein Marky_0304 [Marinithermus hydrothermalis DSM 14884]
MRYLWIVGILLLTGAWAAPLATLYDQVTAKLNASKSLLDTNPVQSLERIDEALSLFRAEAEALPPVLAEGIAQALTDARLAVTRKSKADLEARLWVVRGAFGKALYDAFFNAVAAGDLEAAQALLDRVIQATARTPDLKQKAAPLVASGNLEELRLLFERAYAQAMRKTLELARAAQNRASAYALTSKAYGLYLVVQDSPRASDLSARAFVTAMGRLAQGDDTGFQAVLDDLLQATSAFLERTQPVEAVTVALKEEPEAAPPEPPAETSSASEPAPETAAASPAASPTTSSTSAEASGTTETASSSASPSSSGTALLEEPLPANLREEAAYLPMDPQTAERVAQVIQDMGLESTIEWLALVDEVRGVLANAQTFVETGQYEKARTALSLAHNRYQTKLAPVVEVYNPELAQRMDLLLERLKGAVGLRTSDVVVALGELQEIEEQLFGGTLGPWHSFVVRLELATLGVPRAILFILAGVLAVFPLYLLQLTFGGRNVYWRYLGLAFLFLFLPAMVEALTYVANILADYGDLPQLGILANLSVLQSLLAQLGWGVTIFLVVGFATAGLRGIALQFGLIQDRRAQPTTTSLTTPPANPTLTSETIVEWDEEF